jgi:hypothetical protein
MQKITTLLIIAIFGTTSLLHSVEPIGNPLSSDVAELEYPPSTEDETDTTPPEAAPQDIPKDVAKASEDGMGSASRDAWIKFGVAAAAVTVAVVALVLVSKNKGKKS